MSLARTTHTGVRSLKRSGGTLRLVVSFPGSQASCLHKISLSLARGSHHRIFPAYTHSWTGFSRWLIVTFTLRENPPRARSIYIYIGICWYYMRPQILCLPFFMALFFFFRFQSFLSASLARIRLTQDCALCRTLHNVV